MGVIWDEGLVRDAAWFSATRLCSNKQHRVANSTNFLGVSRFLSKTLGIFLPDMLVMGPHAHI